MKLGAIGFSLVDPIYDLAQKLGVAYTLGLVDGRPNTAKMRITRWKPIEMSSGTRIQTGLHFRSEFRSSLALVDPTSGFVTKPRFCIPASFKASTTSITRP